jgi:ADP-ribosylglycohydrolase
MDAGDASLGARTGGVAERPLPNTYWVRPRRFLAGEYPASHRTSEATSRLRRLLDAGIDYFIDLTEEHELREYESLLAELHPDARYRRFPIEDHGLPEEPAVVMAVLDCIDEAMAAGHNVYLHCRAGVGRTGTVLGCHFVRHGLQNEAALDRLAELWQQSERSRHIPLIPETDAQASYVRFWHEADATAAGTTPRTNDLLHGALLGLAVGEASATGEDANRGCHAAMTLLLAESLMACGGNDPDDQMRRYQLWRKEGRIPGASVPVPLPPPVSRALAAWQWSRKAYAGPHDPANLDPHPLPRTAAVALYFRNQPGLALEAAVDASRTTHQAPIVLDCCRYFAAMVIEALSGTARQAIPSLPTIGEVLRLRALKPEVERLVQTDWLKGAPPAAAQTAPSVLGAALSAFAKSHDFSSGLEIARRVTGDPGAVAAVYGALAGAHYGIRGLAPSVVQLPDRGLIDAVALRLSAGPGQPR